MALLWQKQSGKDRYEVRSAASFLRLYKNGVLHSQYSSRHLFTGSVWDLLAIPAWFLPGELQSRALVLGLGGGASCQLMERLFAFEKITALDIEAAHIEVAKSFFKLNEKKFRFVKAEGRRWVERYQGPKFDYIVEDMFTEAKRQPKRAIEADPAWIRLLLDMLAPHGILVMNFADEGEFKNFSWFKSQKKQNFCQSFFRLRTNDAENIVTVLSRQKLSTSILRQQIAALKKAQPKQRIWPQYSIRQVKT